jgi:hypothetical protein
MSTLSIEKSQNPEGAALKKGSAKLNPASKVKVAAGAANPKAPPKALTTADDLKVERVTKQERVLTLLRRAEGPVSKR